MSFSDEQSVSRPAQYRSSGASSDAARQNSITRPGSAVTPSWRSARAKATSRVTSSGTEELSVRAAEILDVLHRPAQRVAGALPVDSVGAEDRETPRPVDRLGDARRLGQVERPQARHGLGDRARERLRDLRRPQPDDRDLTLERRKVDPVVEAAPLQRVVELAGAVRRDDDERGVAGGDRADLGNRNREVREDLEQERLELVV